MSNLPHFAPEGSYDPSESQNYCSKSLYEQLQEQKNIKLKKFEEEHSFKNAIKMYDDDDLAFVNEVRQSKLLQDKEKENEVKLLVEIAKKKEAERLNNIYDNLDEKIQQLRKSNVEDEKMNVLKAMLKRKRNEECIESANKIPKLDNTDTEMNTCKVTEETTEEPSQMETTLPGMEAYNDSDEDKSDSDSSDTSSDSDIDVGTLRPLIKRLTERIKKNC